MTVAAPTRVPGLLGDTADRDYSRKLTLFNRFAEPELRQAIAALGLQPGMRVVDAGCGSGEALQWLSDAVGPKGLVVGVDLAAAHVSAARKLAPAQALVMQADLRQPPLAEGAFDLVWCVNTVNHMPAALETVQAFSRLLRPGGRIALGQSSLLPDMYFAWDARLERLTTEAVRRYYRERYGLEEADLKAVRAIAGLLRHAGLRGVIARTLVVERLAPLMPADREYLVEAVFRDTWGSRLRPYLTDTDFEELSGLCDAQDRRFALGRPDFHFLQTLTIAVGSR